MIYIKHTIIWFFVTLTITAKAQPFYTQLDNVEPFLSPSLNGMSPNRDIRFSLSYRSNNLNINSPFHSGYASVDGRMFARHFNNRGWLGWGLGGLYDIAGRGQLSTVGIYGNLAYHQMISSIVLLSGGIGVGVNSKTLNDLNALTFPLQWSSAFFDKNISSQEKGFTESVSLLDVKAGANISLLFSQNLVVMAGGSVHNLTEPIEKFYSVESNKTDYKTPMRFSLYAQTYHNLNDIFFAKNSILFSQQGGINNFWLSTAWEWRFSNEWEYIALLFGVNYRYEKIIAPHIGFKYREFRLSLSYDIFMDDFNKLDYYYRMGTEVQGNYYIKYPNTTFEQLITACPGHF